MKLAPTDPGCEQPARAEPVGSQRARWSVLLLVTALATETQATVFVPISIEDLTMRSVAVVVGHVRDLTSAAATNGDIFTLVTLDVEQELRGNIGAASVTLKEPGGRVENRVRVVSGAPRYHAGEHVLVFLSTWSDGSLHTSELALGKLRIEADQSGTRYAVRDLGSGTAVLIATGDSAPDSRMPLDGLVSTIARVPFPEFQPRSSPRPLLTPAEAHDPTLIRQSAVQGDFSEFLPRFFEADEGIPVPFFIDETHDPLLGDRAAQRVWNAAMSSWNDVATSSLTLVNGGPSAPGVLRFDPRSVLFPDGCGGVAGVGGSVADVTEIKRYGGQTFARITAAGATVFSNQPGCDDRYNLCNAARIAAHELGHAIGLEHSGDPHATMSSGPGLDDCRCARLGGDDADAVSARYPLGIPPSITTPAMLPDATVGTFYEQRLVAIGGTGSFTWAFAEDGVSPGVDALRTGLDLSPDGLLSGAPVESIVAPPDYIERGLIRATDTNGDFHSKRFFIRINPAGVTTTTATSTTTSTAVAPTGGDPIPCETTTTSTLPSQCDREQGFPAVRCKAGEAQRLVRSLRGRHVRAARLIARLIRRCDVAHVETMEAQPNLRKVFRLLDRSERDASALEKLARRPRLERTVGQENAERLVEIANALLARLQAVRATVPLLAVP